MRKSNVENGKFGRSWGRAALGLNAILAAALGFGTCAWADEPANAPVASADAAVLDAAISDDATLGGGPCVVGPNGEIVCKVADDGDGDNGAGTSGATDASGTAALPKIDLATKPWLVESANLPPNHPALKRERTIWADSYLWTAIDDVLGGPIPIERWAANPVKPEDLVGKYVLIEMWATWCPPCRRSLPYLKFIAEKYKDDLVVVSICETDEDAIRNMPGKRLDLENVPYSVAVDTGRRLANKLNVRGVPHAILLDPTLGGVVWEGMPTAPKYELDDKTLERFFAIGKKLKAAGRLPEVSPIKFETSEPTDEERATRRNVGKKDCEETAAGEPSI